MRIYVPLLAFVGCLVVVRTAQAQPASRNWYSDSQGRFYCAVPNGWRAEDLGENGVKLSRGGGYCNITHMQSAASGSDFISQILGQVSSQWRGFNIVDQGETAIARLKANYAIGVGTNPKGVPSVFKITAAGTGEQVLIVLASAPQSEYAGMKSGIEEIEQSLALGAAPTAGPPAAVAEKLAALEAACRAGVFSPAECEAKRKSLLESAPAPAYSPGSAPPPAPGPRLRVALGIRFREITEQDAAALNLKRPVGVLITDIAPDGAAQRAGIRAGDILVLVDRKLVENGTMLLDFLSAYQPGDTAELGLLSNGQSKMVRVTFAAASAPAPPPAPPEDSQAAVSPGGVLKFSRLSVRDPGLNNLDAVSFLIPAGWKAEGGIQWLNDYRILVNLILQITDPQTGAAIEFLPIQNFTWLEQMVVPMAPGTNYLGRVIWQPMTDIPQFIQAFYLSGALSRLRNARMVSTRDLPEVASSAAQAQGGTAARSARVRYEYESGGRQWEEDVYVTLVYVQAPGAVFWAPDHAYSLRAPKGLLDRVTPLMTTVVATRRVSEEWFAQYCYVGQLFDQRMRQGIRNAGILSDTIARNNEEIRQMFAESYRQRSASEDRISRSFTEYIRGVETYRNPYDDRPVQLPSGYSNVWVNRAGEYILSNQAGFNPNVGSNAEWQQISRAQ